MICGEINPLAVHNLRELKHKVPHAEVITFKLKTHEKIIVNWLYENTAGRFFVETTKNDKGFMDMTIAFENHEESSFFALQMDAINKG